MLVAIEVIEKNGASYKSILGRMREPTDIVPPSSFQYIININDEDLLDWVDIYLFITKVFTYRHCWL
jgi:hypothetical protein